MLLMFLPENEEYTVFLPFKFRIDSKAAKQRREMNMVNHLSWGRLVFVFPVFFSALLVVAQERHEKKETYTVGPRAILTVVNDCGPITVRASRTGKVLVTMVWHALAVEFINEQHGDRLDLRAKSDSSGANLAEYTVLVPTAEMVTIRSPQGNVFVQGVSGDVALETSSSPITISDVADAHIKARSLSGSIKISEVHQSHVDLYSVKGDIQLHNVGSSWLEGHSSTGKITYDGDPGMGEYKLFSQFGDLEVSIPSAAKADIKARSFKSDQDIHVPEMSHPNSFLKSQNQNASRFKLRSLRGDIRVTRP